MKPFAKLALIVFSMALFSGKSFGKEVERSDYKITVPDTCTEDPRDGDVDLDHMTTINFPKENFVIVLVLDDKSLLKTTFNRMLRNYKGKLKQPADKEGSLVNSHKGKSIVLTGVLNGATFRFEVGAFAGKTKAFIVVTSSLESEQNERSIIQKSVDSFTIKE